MREINVNCIEPRRHERNVTNSAMWRRGGPYRPAIYPKIIG